MDEHQRLFQDTLSKDNGLITKIEITQNFKKKKSSKFSSLLSQVFLSKPLLVCPPKVMEEARAPTQMKVHQRVKLGQPLEP